MESQSLLHFLKNWSQVRGRGVVKKCVSVTSCYMELVSCEGCMESHERWWNSVWVQVHAIIM